ncbi:MAG: tetratricopeptide repeat protein [Planctomycetes bacterium]|nr:tetratricopeptide repeat protein [Planctomycetota bacterium]
MMSTLDESLAIGTQLHQAGRLAEAERAYRQVLSADPGHPHALHQLGLLALQARQFETAIELIGQAVRADRRQAVFHANLGESHRHSGNAAEAEACFRRALKLQPGLAKAHGLLAIVLHGQGKLDEAAAALRQALRQTPDDAEIRTRLGVVLEQQGKLAEAEACFRRALRSDGKAADASEIFSANIDVDCKAATALGAVNLAAAVKDFLRDYTGAAGSQTISAVNLNGEGDSPENPIDASDVARHVTTLELTIHWKP